MLDRLFREKSSQSVLDSFFESSPPEERVVGTSPSEKQEVLYFIGKSMDVSTRILSRWTIASAATTDVYFLFVVIDRERID